MPLAKPVSMRVVGWVGRQLLPLTVAGLVVLSALGDAAAQGTAPGAPAAPTVAAGDGALAVSWAAPVNPGSAAIAAYDIRYILTSADETDDANWSVVEDIWTGAGSLAYTLISLSNGAQHDVQVRAVSSAGDGDWSPTTAATPTDHGNSRDVATAVTLGASVVGSIADGADDDFFSFSLSEASDLFVYTTSYLAGFLATTGELQDSMGSVVANDDGTSLYRPHGQQLFLWGSLGAGDYYVKVSAAEAGTYTLHTELVTESTGLADAGPLAMGGEANGILATATEDADYFRLEVAEATSVLLRLARTAQLDLRGELLDDAGGEIAAQDDSFLSGSLTPEFFLPLSLEAGVYYLRVSGSPGGEFVVCNEDSAAGARENGDDCSDPRSKPANTGTGPYTVSAEVISEAGTDFVSTRALQLGANRATAGVIESAGDAHYYSLTVSEPTYVTIEARSKDLHLEGALYKTDQTATGGVLDTVYVAGGLGFRLEATLASGTSYLTVEARDGSSTGGYIVRVTENTAYRAFIGACTGLTTSVTDPLYGCQWHLDNTGRNAAAAGEDINVAEVWSGGNLGAAVNVAIVDDGIHAGHVDLTDNVDAARNHDYTGNGAAFTPPHAHGTQLAGIVAARGNALGVRGVAPQAKVYGYNLALDPTLANMADAITREMATTAVSLNGWGFADGPGLDFADALWEAAVVAGISSGFGDNGVLYVFPAGNGAQLGDHANLSEFANHYGVTAVCAVNDKGVRAGYSERGDNLWVCGPSGDIPRNGRQGIATTEPYDRYTQEADGTGAAAAAVAGVAALVRKANPALTWRDVKLILAASARKNDPADQGWSTGALKYGSTSERYNFNRSYGFGVVDAKAAVDLAAGWNAPSALRTVQAATDGNLDLAIPQSATYAESPISVGPGVDFVEYVEVEAVMRHSAFREVDIELVSPSGAVSRLAVYMASAPALALRGGVRLGTARHLGEDPSGTWTLRVRDGALGNDGVLLSWSLTIYGHGRPTDFPVITGVNSASTALTVTWTIDDAAGVTAYDVRHIASTATDKGDSNWTVTDNAWTSTAGGALSYAITGLTNGTSYDVQVRPVRDTTDGSWSETAVGTPAAAAGAAPAITSVRAEEQVLTVAWSAPASPPATVTGYGVRHIRSAAADKATDANWTVVSAATNSASVRTYTITGLTNDVGYDVQVRAVTANGNGAWSATATGLPADFPDLLEQAPLIPLNTPIHGHLTGTTDVDWFRLNIGAATELVAYTTGDADTSGYLRNSDDSTSVSNDDSDHDDSTLNFKIIRAVGTGTWYLEVKDISRIGGNYVLRVESRTESTATSNAPTLSLGGAYAAALDSSSDDDYYKLVISSSTDVILRSSGPTDTKGTLLQSNGTTSITSNESGQLVEGNFDLKGNTNFLIRRTLSAGTYYLKVEDQSDSGGYKVHASAASSPGTSRSAAAALTLDVAGAGGIGSATDADFFSFTLTEPRTVGVTAAGSPAADSGDLLIQGELQDAGGTKLRDYGRYRPDREVGFRDIHRLEAGTYYVKVTGSTTASREKYVVLVYTFDEHNRRGAKCAGGEPRFTDPLANCQWHLHHPGLPDIDVVDLNLQDVWDSYKGAGVNVAVVDNSMEYTHPDLFPNVNVSLNHSYLAGRTIESLYESEYYSITPHGTKVAGIIAAAENDLGVLGVAPKATIYGYNLLRDRTAANEADAMTRNMAVTAVSNNSWGPSDNGKLQVASGAWKQAINRGVTEGNGGKGISYVWAAGNGGAVRRGSRVIDHSNLDEYANYWGVTAVGEHDIFGNKVPTSEAGTNLWVTVPTVWESSPEWWAIRIPNIPAGYPRPAVTTTDGGYAYMSNFDATSAAAPMAAGVIALMRQANPALTWRDVKLILAETSRKVQPDDPRWVTGAPVYLTPGTRYSHSLENGFGALNAKAAVERAITWTNVPALHTLDSGWQGYSGLDVPNDDGATSLELTFTVEEEIPFIEYIHIPMAMNHDYFRELQIELISPSGIVAVLQSSRVLETDYVLHHWRGNQHNFGDAAHLGESTKGVWTLRITDPSSQTYFDYDNLGVQTTSGRFAGWRLRFYGHGNMPGRPEFPSTGAITAGTRSLAVNWTAPAVTGATAITRYDLRYSFDDGASWAVREDIWQSGNLTYPLTGLFSAAEHMVQVRAVNSHGIGLWSESATGTPMVPTVAAPAIASVTPSDASLGVVWTAPAGALPGEITSYDLRYILTSADETADSNWTEVSGVWASGPLHYLQASLANASQYDIQVRAVNGSRDPPVNGAWSGTTTGTPAATINVEVAWVTAATSVAESAGTVTLQASMVTKEAGTLPSAFSMPVTVAVSGPTIAPADYSLASETVTFAFADFSPETIGGQPRHKAVKDIIITIADDDVDELDEVMTVTLDYPGLVLPHQKGGGAFIPVTITSDDEGPVRIGWEDAEVRVDESAGTVTLRAFAVTTQDAAPAAGYALRTTITTIAETAVRSTSFTPVTRRITLGASDFAQATVEGQPRYRAVVEVILTITDDALDEPDEEITVALAVLGPSPAGLAGSPAVARVTIVDNDHVPVALSWSTASPTVAEADGTLVLMAQVTTLVDKAPESGFTVPLTAATADGTATQPADYTAVTESFSFSTSDFTRVTVVGGQQRYRTARDIPVTVVADTDDELSETFTVTLAYGDPASHLTGSSAVANVTLTDSNQAEVTLEWNETAVTAAEPDTAGGARTVTLTAVATTMGENAPDPGFDLDFTVVTADGTATQPADYTGLSTNGSFDETDFSSITVAGNPRYRATMDFTISVADDTIDEPDETFSVTLALDDASIDYLSAGNVTATVTITDNDHVPVTLSWDNASITVVEAAATITLTAQVTTETDKAPETGFTVDLSVASANGTATAGTDYTAVADTYTYTPSDFTRVLVGTVYRYRATKALNVAILHDTADEPDETFTLTFAYAGMDLPPHLKGGNGVATLTITDNDHVPVDLSWDTAAPSVNENTGTFTLTAQVTTTKDKAPETGFTVGLSVASANGTAAAPGDFTAVSETFSFSPSDFSAVTVGAAQRYRATKAFTVAVVDDAVDEPNETFTVALAYTGAAMPHLAGGSKTATVTVVDTTQAMVTLAWQSVTAAVDEPPASGGTTTVTLTAIATTAADQPPDAGFALDFTVTSADGTASAPADYTAVSRTESFAVGDFASVTVGGATRYRATRGFTVTIIHDTVDEENETLTMTLALSQPSITYLLLGDAVATVTIVDNDHVPVALSWDPAAVTVNEDAGALSMTAQVTTTKNKAPETGFTIGLSVASAAMGATDGEDYTAVNGNIAFTPGDFTAVDVAGQQRYRATRTYDVAIFDDTTDEEDERFTVTLAYAGAAQPHLTGGSARATVTIADDDHVPVTLGWDATQFTVEEPTSPHGSSSLTLTVRAVTVKDKQPDPGFSFDYRAQTADDGAMAPDDYAALSVTGTIARSDFARTSVDGQFRWVAEKEHTIAIVYDTTDEPVEDFAATLAYETPGLPHLLEGGVRATVSITDDIASLADLETTVTPSATRVMREDRLTYSWIVENSGPAASTNTTLTLILDRQMVFVSATPAAQCTEEEGVITCAMGTIEKDASAAGTVVSDVIDDAAADIAFSAEAKGDQLERTPGDNEASLATTLVAPPEPVADLRALASITYVDLRWMSPSNNGSPITAYELERKSGDEDFAAVMTPPDVAETTWRDEEVELNTRYTYRLRAVNEDGTADWSEEISAIPHIPPPDGGGGGGFGAALVAPQFVDGFRTSRTLALTARVGDAVGDPVAATHPEDSAVTYSLSGVDAALFTVDEETGQIRLGQGVTLALGRTYTVNLTATDSSGTGSIIIVVIEVAEGVGDPYDLNRNGMIEKDEILAAVSDYFAGVIEKDEVLALVTRYFAA